MIKPDCNNCDVGRRCSGALSMKKMSACKRFVAPSKGFKLAELALTYLSGPNVNIKGYNRREV